MVSTNAAEAPVVKVDVQAYDGVKQYLKVRFNNKSQSLMVHQNINEHFSLYFMYRFWKLNTKICTVVSIWQIMERHKMLHWQRSDEGLSRNSRLYKQCLCRMEIVRWCHLLHWLPAKTIL